MRQYFGAKAEHPDDVLLFRMGDFWETFFDDAHTLSRVAGIALTSRGVEQGEPIPLAGVPLASLEATVRKLVTAGHRVAICDQVEDPKSAKGIVRREVVEVVSAGTVSLPGILDERVERYLVAIATASDGTRAGIARCDITTGELAAAEIETKSLRDELDRIAPAEILLPEHEAHGLDALVPPGASITRLPAGFAPDAARATDAVSSGPGFAPGHAELAAFQPLAVCAAGMLLAYLETLCKAERAELAPLALDASGSWMVVDETTLRNLEILRPLSGEDSKGTLLACVDRTRTSMGARLLRRWLVRPLLSPEGVAIRQDGVAEIMDDDAARDAFSRALEGTGDVERLAMRVGAGRANARDLVALARSLAVLPALRARLGEQRSAALRQLGKKIEDFAPETETIQETLVDAPPVPIAEGGLVREGVSAELDRLRSLSRDAKAWIARFQTMERERTGIANLRVGYNRVFGYYIEVTRGNRELVPTNYERRQTLAGAERFVTPELKEREAEILGAEERGRGLEHDIFLELRSRVARRAGEMRRAAQALAELDVLLSFADIARSGGWIRPVVEDSGSLVIRAGRHPVVEALLPAHEFVPNDVELQVDSRQILLVTGPNMAGKSTYLRQVALLVLLAQVGSFVPADSAVIGVVDRIFTRVGASDHLARGHSTFMVEMTEVSRILDAATRRSLVLLDEVGRGTSTYDGLAIAWSVLEHLHETPERAARTLFATHFHELTVLADRLGRARNVRVTVHEWKDDVVFLRKIVEGAADRSFGIQVAKLAGLPESVTKRARKILGELERGTFLAPGERADGAQGPQLDLFSRESASILAELHALDPESMTPLESLAVLSEWSRRARSSEPS